MQRPNFELPPLGVELYDHANDTEADFDAYENVDLATAPEHNATLRGLLRLLITTWDNGKLPPIGQCGRTPAPRPPHTTQHNTHPPDRLERTRTLGGH